MTESNTYETFEYLRSEVVQAGAGAGKTTRLIDKVLRLAQDHYKQKGHFPRVVVTTFTRRATQELKERLMLKAEGDLVNFVSSPFYLHISTIHGVLNILLSSYGQQAGLESTFRFIAPEQETQNIRQILRELLLSQPEYQELLQDYSVSELCFLLKNFYEKKIQYANYFKPFNKNDLCRLRQKELEKAAGEIDKIAAVILGETDNAKWLEYSDDLKKMSQIFREKSWDEIKNILEEFKPQKPRKSSKKNPVVSDETEELCKTIGAFWKKGGSNSFLNEKFSSNLWEKYLHTSRCLEKLGHEFYDHWSAVKWKTAKITMSDLETLGLQFVREHKQVVKKFSSEWDYWLIDEYQDTSPLQVELLRDLVGKSPSFVVGDPQQSIYLFRGARSEVFFEKQKEGHEKGADIDFLKKNYRSHGSLLEFFNDLFTAISPQFQLMIPNDEGRQKNRPRQNCGPLCSSC